MRGIGRIVAVLLVGLLVVSVSEPARAQSPGDQDLSAKEAYKKGAEHYENQNFEKAAEYFRYAVDKKSHPVLHFNLSQAYLSLGQLDRALEQAEIAARKGPLNESASAANRATLAGGQVVARARDWQPPADEPAEEESGPPDPHEMVDDEDSGSPALSALGWGGIGGIGAGLGLIAGAAAVDSGLNSDFTARKQARRAGNTGRVETLTGRIQSKQTTGRILLFSGIGLAVAGGGLLTYDLIRRSSSSSSGSGERATVRGWLIPTPHGCDAALRIAF